MKSFFAARESLAASAFRATVRSFLGHDLTHRFERALFGDSDGEGKEKGDVAALLGFADEFRQGAAVELSARRWLLPRFSEDQALALVAFAGLVRKYGSAFGESPRPLLAAA